MSRRAAIVVCTVFLFLIVGTYWLSWVTITRSIKVENGLQEIYQEQSSPEHVQVTLDDGTMRIYVRGLGEPELEWAERVARIISGVEGIDNYLCTTLTGCEPPVQEIEVCTPCNSSPPSPSCEARHAASVAAFCMEFSCTDCGD